MSKPVNLNAYVHGTVDLGIPFKDFAAINVRSQHHLLLTEPAFSHSDISRLKSKGVRFDYGSKDSERFDQVNSSDLVYFLDSDAGTQIGDHKVAVQLGKFYLAKASAMDASAKFENPYTQEDPENPSSLPTQNRIIVSDSVQRNQETGEAYLSINIGPQADPRVANLSGSYWDGRASKGGPTRRDHVNDIVGDEVKKTAFEYVGRLKSRGVFDLVEFSGDSGLVSSIRDASSLTTID